MTSEIFDCRKCGECCKGYGGTFVTRADIEAIAEYIDSDSETFVDDYCVLSGGKPVLKQAESGFCVFWDRLCTIHPVKPRMCKAWPFLGCVLTDINNWRIMSNSCPGIRTDVSDSLIKECISAQLSK